MRIEKLLFAGLAAGMLTSSAMAEGTDHTTPGASQDTAAAVGAVGDSSKTDGKAVPGSGTAAESWTDKIKLKGDLRTRYEYIDQDEKDERHRFRIRARLGVNAEVTDDVDVIFRFASGSDDPVSTNQTLTGGFSKKDFNIDQAYIDLHPGALEGTNLWLGKMEQPFIAVRDLIWDGDLTPEGAAFKYAYKSEPVNLSANLAAYSAEERSSDSDTYMYGGQFAAEANIAKDSSVTAGVSYYLWDEVDDRPPLFDAANSFGNSTISDGMDGLLTAEEFGELEWFLQAKLDPGLPLEFYADFVTNTEADNNNDFGWMVGASVGKAKKPGSFQLDYNYRDLEADAVIGAFTDSDSCGGGTNCEGHRVQATYQLMNNVQIAATVFVNQKDPDEADIDYTRFQLDLIAKL